MIFFAGAGCNEAKPSVPAKTQAAAPLRDVQTWTVQLQPRERVVKAAGSLASYEQSTLGAKVAGRLQSIAVDLGSVARKGEVIAQIEPTDYRLRLQQSEALLAQARVRLGLPLDGTDDTIDPENTSVLRQTRAVLDEAVANRERLDELTRQGIASKAERETVEATYRVALGRHQDSLEEVKNRQALLAQRRAELEIAKQNLADTEIQAPYDCAIQARIAGTGEYLALGDPVMTVVRMNPLRLRLEVPERDAISIKQGQNVRLAIEGSTNIYTGLIERLIPVIDEAARILRVEADVPNPGPLRPGAFARAEIVVENSSPSLAVPKSALVVFAGSEKVFVVEDNKSVERPVRTGREWSDSIEITRGLRLGERLITNPGNIRAGEAVNVAP